MDSSALQRARPTRQMDYNSDDSDTDMHAITPAAAVPTTDQRIPTNQKARNGNAVRRKACDRNRFHAPTLGPSIPSFREEWAQRYASPSLSSARRRAPPQGAS